MTAWPWQDGGYNMKTHGDYSVTKHHTRLTDPEWEYLAWFQQGWIGSFDSFKQAAAECERHAAKRGSR